MVTIIKAARGGEDKLWRRRDLAIMGKKCGEEFIKLVFLCNFLL